MSLTQAVSYIDREQLGLFYISCPVLLRFRGPHHENTSPPTLPQHCPPRVLKYCTSNSYWKQRVRMFGLAQSQKMDGKSFCRNFLDLVWFSAYVVHREVGVSLLWLLAPPLPKLLGPPPPILWPTTSSPMSQTFGNKAVTQASGRRFFLSGCKILNWGWTRYEDQDWRKKRPRLWPSF